MRSMRVPAPGFPHATTVSPCTVRFGTCKDQFEEARTRPDRWLEMGEAARRRRENSGRPRCSRQQWVYGRGRTCACGMEIGAVGYWGWIKPTAIPSFAHMPLFIWPVLLAFFSTDFVTLDQHAAHVNVVILRFETVILNEKLRILNG
ncbi:hypothetical protein SEVIR_9G414800v4 [Setaria viridis]|uniref:Uncharacterized protein n=1 Tax=Setaria viridis TaxID=4556 RepID=A0A4U6T6W1_SETVI|nr:hypothetical protein SEVIR_9G414800v2 [Setaria viridis]